MRSARVFRNRVAQGVGWFALPLLACVLGGCSTAQPSARRESNAELERQLVRLMNQVRAINGAAPLEVDPRLSELAREHTQSFVGAGQAKHSPFMRNLKQRGYNPRTAGENVGIFPGSIEDAHRMFLASRSHNANILSKDFEYVGVCVIEHELMLHVTELFATPRK